ncbi:DUF6825 family protein [Prochlorococcus sp. MIT 1307]|uniref:DUF6825 family protein n=1 Tax=Prochlorococcus sp. MIT 1307 TaxID=3096219 RepID=UPI002A748B76|nr:hypothetical protein [Prochlorococcus sp. MIT 1307]
MSASDNLLKATLNRLGVRIGEKLIKSVAELAVIAQDAPERLRTEWELFQEEVMEEANRLDKETNHESSDTKQKPNNPNFETPQERIDRIRAKAAELNSKLEAKS